MLLDGKQQFLNYNYANRVLHYLKIKKIYLNSDDLCFDKKQNTESKIGNFLNVSPVVYVFGGVSCYSGI